MFTYAWDETHSSHPYLNLTVKYGIVRSLMTSHTMTLSSGIILAVLLDHWLGEPNKYHPLVAFGKLARRIENHFLNKNLSPNRQLYAGLLALLLLTAPLCTLLISILQLPWLDLLLPPLVLYFCIAPSSLKQHAEAVLNHLKKDDLPAAKTAVGYIVSRETERMNAVEVRKATIESVLENGADAVFAPLFWFVAAGPAGALLYRLVNTLDAMWGYKTPRYLYFGRTAARLDDLLNWLPARLTAFSYALLGHTRLALKCWRQQARYLESPNAGPVMAAGAGALALQLGGPAWYHGELKDKIVFGGGKPPQNADIVCANRLITNVLASWLILIAIGDFFA